MTNYSRGRSREYKTMHLLRSKGWVCSRSAMSHGPVDVFAARRGKVLLIQVKSGSARIKKNELDLLQKWAEAFDAEAQVWSFKKMGNLEKVTVRARTPSHRTVKRKNKSEDKAIILRRESIPLALRETNEVAVIPQAIAGEGLSEMLQTPASNTTSSADPRQQNLPPLSSV